MSSLENMLCLFCKNSTIISTEKPLNYIFNKSVDEKSEMTTLYSICTSCNKYSYVKENTLLYNETFSKLSNILTDIKYDPKLLTVDTHCKACKTDTQYKMFATSNSDLRFKYICMNCDQIFNSISN